MDDIYVFPAEMDTDRFMQWLEEANIPDLEEFGSGESRCFVAPGLRKFRKSLPPPNPNDRNQGMR
jgi:hypothetical protein